MSIVVNVLRGPGRDRYDHFLRNGFPTWKGTEYYYSRYRPGLGTVLVGVFLFGGGAAHYLILLLSWKRQREFVERYIKFARHAAWGENLGVPGVDTTPVAAPPPPPPQEFQDEEGRPIAVNRKMRRLQERDAKKEAAKEAQGGRRGRKAPASGSGSGTATPLPAPTGSGPTGSKKRVVAENGKVLVVDSLGDVYLEQQDEEGNPAEYLLDVSSFLVAKCLWLPALTLYSPMNCRSLPSKTRLSFDSLSWSTSSLSAASCRRVKSKATTSTRITKAKS